MEKVIRRIQSISKAKDKCIVAIDGRCAAGKSTYGEFLARHLNAALFHMDDFFLRPEQRTAERYSEPGGNVDRERFQSEILEHIHEDKEIYYCPFDCQTMSLKEARMVPNRKIVIVEGSYSMHPQLQPFYDFKMFMHVNSGKQLSRIRKRNPDKVDDFRNKWIPMEEKYFIECEIAKHCDIFIDTSLEW